jgi:hypothetical protein
MKKNLRMITVLDNGGETLDRYTIINRENGDLLGASHNPFHPCGVGLYNHNIADEYWFVAWGYSWRKHCDVKKCTKFAVDRYLNDTTGIGKKIKLSELPEDVIKFIHQSINE